MRSSVSGLPARIYGAGNKLRSCKIELWVQKKSVNYKI